MKKITAGLFSLLFLIGSFQGIAQKKDGGKKP